MKTLHWHTDADPCTLAGFPVTPESWEGGIVTPADGGWLALGDPIYFGDSFTEYFRRYDDTNFTIEELAPVYPPRGWNGLSERDIWQRMTGKASIDPYITADSELTIAATGEWEVGVIGHAVTVLAYQETGYGSAPESRCFEASDLPLFLRALQNAQVLSNRLKEQA